MKRLADTPAIITFVTGKLKEVQSLLDGSKVSALTVVGASFELPEFQGDTDFISQEKCKLASSMVKGPVFVEDTALCFEALGGMPGPYIKWFLQKLGCDGLHKLLSDFPSKRAWAQTTFSYSEGEGQPIHTFVGKTYGYIVAPRGIAKFHTVSWDPVFEPFLGPLNDQPGEKTYAEMSAEEKNAISHRMKSLKLLTEYLSANPPSASPLDGAC